MPDLLQKAAVYSWPEICRSVPKTFMPLKEDLLKKINQQFTPSAKISLRYRRYNLVLLTDKEGRAVQLFMGTAREDGTIRGDRYARTLKYDREGRLIKDHWERKGKAI